jgi:hypothetical protein
VASFLHHAILPSLSHIELTYRPDCYRVSGSMKIFSGSPPLNVLNDQFPRLNRVQVEFDTAGKKLRDAELTQLIGSYMFLAGCDGRGILDVRHT